MKILRGGLRKFLDTRKGGSEKVRGGFKNLYTSKLTGGGRGGVGPLKKLNRKRDICTLDYSKRVMNNHAGSTLTRTLNSTDEGECYPPRPSASGDNTLLHL